MQRASAMAGASEFLGCLPHPFYIVPRCAVWLSASVGPIEVSSGSNN